MDDLHEPPPAGTSGRLQRLLATADIAGLLAVVDRMCAAREWEALIALRARCMEAVEWGKPLWPIAMHIDYRLAWQAPARYAGAVLRPGGARFALGPLTEVAAAGHEWEALEPHVHDPASAGAVAQERVLRGEDLRGRAPGVPAELPLHLCEWEPSYALPRYGERAAQFPAPDVASRPQPPPSRLLPGLRLAEDDGVRALRAVTEIWVSQSAGSSRAVMVEGGAAGAVAQLVEAASLLVLEADEAMALLQWAGASGGAYGHRRGGAAGRFSAWWAAAALAGLEWPEQPGAGEVSTEGFAELVGAAVAELRWFAWDRGEAMGNSAGWILRLAVEDPQDGLAWAVEAVDARAPGDEPEELATGMGTDIGTGTG